jgi:alkylation response protein AidB-like acyl-CoA dehydrogenase
VDDTLQIKGGRGYETADSLRSRGEKPDAVERMMRDFRINLIFEGSSEVMRLFIAREAVDTHFKIAGALIDPKAPMKAKVNALLKSALFYGVWYPRLWLSLRGRFGFGEFGRLAGHMRFVERRSRKLGRTIFHCMVRFGPKLEKRQAVLGRIVEIGAELFAMAATCARAVAAGQEGRPTGKDAVELADAFCRQASRRVDEKFAAVWRNDDVNTYAVARKVLDGGYSWLERGMVGTRGD